MMPPKIYLGSGTMCNYTIILTPCAVNNLGKVYRHNNRVVYHSIVVYMEDNYHTHL